MDNTGEFGFSAQVNRRDLIQQGLRTLIAGGLGTAIWVNGCRNTKRSKKRPSVFLITIDTLRQDYLGCYGQAGGISPHIDEFAAESVIFENCYSQASATRFSFAAMLTGFYPHETKVISGRLPAEALTIAELLQKNGYTTAAVVSNYVLRKKNGFEQGFDIYDDKLERLEVSRPYPERIAPFTTDAAVDLLENHRKNPLFMWIHYQDPHGPYVPPPPYSTMFLEQNPRSKFITFNSSVFGHGGIPTYQRLGDIADYYYYLSQYKGEIRYQDEHLGRLLAKLKELALYDDSIIIISSDHGECLGEHDYYFCHGENLYQPLIHVPLLIKYPNAAPARRKDTVQHLDLFPTLCAMTDIKPPKGLRGIDLRRPDAGQRDIFVEMNIRQFPQYHNSAVISGDMKLIYSHSTGNYELYNLAVDPGEKNNLFDSSDYAQLRKNLNRRLQNFCTEDLLQLDVSDEGLILTPKEKEKLRSLGYVE